MDAVNGKGKLASIIDLLKEPGDVNIFVRDNSGGGMGCDLC
jgi:hypothetical protein